MSKRSERLFAAMNEIDERKIDEAAPGERGGRLYRLRWAVAAAALALVIGAGSYLVRVNSGGNPGDSDAPEDGAGGAGVNQASVFMSYAGPVLPLTLGEEKDGITAEREITLDFALWMEESSRDIEVTDAYTLTNHAGEDQTVSLCYPFVGELSELQRQQPVLTGDGEELQTALYAGGYAGSFVGTDGTEGGERWNLNNADSWERYKTVLSDGTYQRNAFDAWPDLSDIPVIVYKFTDPQGSGGEAPTIQAAFHLDDEKTTVLSYSFNGYSYDEETGLMSRDYFIPRPGHSDYEVPRYLIVLGDDVRDMTFQGYENGGCEPDEKMEASVDVRRYETSLEDALREVAQEMYRSWSAWTVDAPEADFELFFGLMKENLLSYGTLSENPAERYNTDRLDDLDFYWMKRIFYLEAEVTVPAKGSITVSATLTKAGSCDFYCEHTENEGVYGYDMLTNLGSNLECTAQTAVLEDRGQIELVRQNFGFDLENGVRKVTLEPKEEHYYLEVREREN